MMNKKYKLEIDPRILTVLSQNLYSNLYYVLSELIANAYDADAHNVYIKIDNSTVIVEDDGCGMNNDEVDKYLIVGNESRNSEANAKTKLGRNKIGRKGIGKLSALSISTEYKLLTKQNGVTNGFIVRNNIKRDEYLTSIEVKDEMFEFIKETKTGTRVEIFNANFQFNDDIDIIAKNILKIFPILSKDFKLNIFYKDKHKVLQNYDEEIIQQLSTL
ncbi:MAG: ATP-binding protein, partial [Bacilli bacterium]|nr:ATP-binding protein [Bacilli bacterium]